MLAVIVAGTTIVVLGQLLSRQFRRSEPERMVLSSLGLTRAQLLAEPVAQAGAAVVLGAVAAALLAYAWSGSFPRSFVRRIEPHPGHLLDPLAHVVGPAVLALTILVWMLCALAPRRDDDAPVRPPGLADRLAPSMPSATAALGVHFALGREPVRSRTVRIPILALILICALVFGALTFGRNLGLIIDRPIRYGVNYDVTLGQGGRVTRRKVAQLLGRTPVARDIAAITLYGAQKVDVERAALDLIGMDPLRGHLVPDVLSGRLPAGSDEIAIGRVHGAPAPCRHAADTITISPSVVR